MKLLSYTGSGNAPGFVDGRFPFCFSKGFSDYIGHHKKEKLEFLSNGRYIIPFALKKHRLLTSLQFHFAPLDFNGEPLNSGDEKEFLEDCISFLKKNRTAHRILQPANYALFRSCPSGSRQAAFGTFQVKLQGKSPGQLLEHMQARYRTAIRQVQNNPFQIDESDEALNKFAALHKKTMARTGSYFEDLKDLLAMKAYMPGQVLVRNIYIGDEIQGGLFILYSKFGAFYMHGASADTTQAQGAIKYLHYDTMVKLADEDVKVYDFVGARLSNVEGTKLEGIQNFKRRFGSELIEGCLWKMDLDQTKCKVFDVALKTKNLLRGARGPEDIIEQEIKKLK